VSATISAPDEQQKLAEVSSEVSAVVARAREVEVTTPEQAQDATAYLIESKEARRHLEATRKEINADAEHHIKKFNAIFKEKTGPLDEADKLVRAKLKAFVEEQERLRVEEQARLDAQRKAEEEKAAEERRRAEEEAARIEREAVEAEVQRQAKIAAQRGKRRKEIAVMGEESLLALHAESSNAGDVELARTEILARQENRNAQERAATARREAEEATQRSIAAQAAPPSRAAGPSKLASTAGSAAVRHEWKAVVVNEFDLPREYLTPDVKKINAVVKAGVRSIPGVRIEQVSGLAVRANG
jgi:hypothetical protein